MGEVIDTSGWIATAGAYRAYPRLTGEQRTDWLIIGGGLTGLSAARRLAQLRPRERIVLIEGKRIAQGASGRNSGFVVGYDLPEHPGYGIFPTKAHSSAQLPLDVAGAGEVRAMIRELKLDCAYHEEGFFYGVHEPALFAKAEGYAEEIRQSGGEARVLESDELKSRFGIDFYRKALLIGGAGNGFLHSARYSKGLADNLPEGVEAFEGTRALEVSRRTGGGAIVEIEGGRIDAAKVIVGLNALLPRLGFKRDRIFPVTVAGSMTRPLTPGEEERIGRARPWALLSPVKGGCTIRLLSDRRLLARNTAEYRPEGLSASQLGERRKVHLAGLRKRFPWLPEDAIEYTWSGSICISRNGRFVFEELQPGIFAAACYNGIGVTRGTLLGRLIAEHAAGERSKLVDLALSLDKPTRIPPEPIFRPLAQLRFRYEMGKSRTEA
jgi:glycine/D-amino acid oxidase-like deaminating enzyme